MTALISPRTAIVSRVWFRDLLVAEWIKLWSLRSTFWVFGLSALTVIGINANAAYADYSDYPSYSPGTRAGFERFGALRDAFTNNAAMILMLAAGSIGAIMIVSEYGTGGIRSTFAAVPARRSVIGAKVTIVTVVMTALGTFIAAASFGLTQAILAGRHAGLSITYPGALRIVAASALLAPVCALVGMGIGTVIRHSATTIVTTTVTLLLLPLLIDSNTHRWVRHINNAMPFTAWDRLTYPGAYEGRTFVPPTITGSWIVYVAWPLASIVLAMIVVDRRDL